MSQEAPELRIPKLAPGEVVTAVVVTPGKRLAVGIVTAEGAFMQLDPHAAAELGRRLISTATQALEQQAFTDFLTEDMKTTMGVSKEDARHHAEELAGRFLEWRAKRQIAQYERQHGKKVQTI